MITQIISTQKPNILEIRWSLNNVCNFKCRYCFPGSNEGNFPSPNDLDLTIKNFNHMLSCYKRDLGKTRFDIKILGGEPTVWKNLTEFLSGIKKEHDVYTSIISNGSRTLRWWEENGHLIDNLILSFHYEQADLQHTVAVADIMYALGKKVTVHVLMDDKNWDNCISSIEYMKQTSKYKWMIQSKEIITTTNNQVNYTEEQRLYLQKEIKRFPSIRWILSNVKLLLNGTMRLYESKFFTDDGKKGKATSQHYLTTEQNNFKGWDCNIGIESVYINHTGEVMGSCGQTILGKRFNILSNDFTKVFETPTLPTTCSIDGCYCPPETNISKVILLRNLS